MEDGCNQELYRRCGNKTTKQQQPVVTVPFLYTFIHSYEIQQYHSPIRKRIMITNKEARES